MLWGTVFGFALVVGYFGALLAIAKSLPKGRPHFALSQLFIAVTAVALALGFIAWYAKNSFLTH